MTYKGDNIGDKPSLTLVEVCVNEKGFCCEPQDAYNYWSKKNWLTRKGTPVKSLEIAISVYNGIIVERAMRPKKISRKKARKKVKSIIQSKRKTKWIPYDEQLQNKNWSEFRKFVLCVRGCRCEMCGSDEALQIHHPKYRSGAKAWEYNCTEVIVLCRNCHKSVHGIV